MEQLGVHEAGWIFFSATLAAFFFGSIFSWANKKNAEHQKNKKTAFASLYYPLTAVTGAIAALCLLFAFIIACAVTDSHKQDTPDYVITIDRLVAGESVPIQSLRPLLAVGIDPLVDEWCSSRDVPKEKRNEVLRVISKKFRAMEINLDLPPEISCYAKPPIENKNN